MSMTAVVALVISKILSRERGYFWCWKVAMCSSEKSAPPISRSQTKVWKIWHSGSNRYQQLLLFPLKSPSGSTIGGGTGVVCQYLQQSHLKVTVDALHVAQDPLPVRTACSQHLLYCLWNKVLKKRKAQNQPCVYFKTNQTRLNCSPQFARSRQSLLFWRPDWDSPSTETRDESMSRTP